MNTELTNAVEVTRKRSIGIASCVLVVAMAIGGYLLFSGPSDAESVKVVCAMRTTTNTPIIDATKNNTRDDLAQGLRDRAKILDDAAGKTGGSIHDSLKKYASVMKKLADSIKSDTSGASLAEMVKKLSTNKELSSASKTLTTILDTKC